ncbi:hypothetical protein BDP27DRAFT_1327717 [Rhodocollybia butyracea]|uniref:FHA domain-containing protein n=1 Tax=Rhodocollybia butyracea TaxID=206335 RepID=A0A9P5PUD9_9AGAR|nr:hypothetical protein BDP27DRAFT_1327717 [Rhodocollybia butyracea]
MGPAKAPPAGMESPPSRSTILGLFPRGKPVNSATSNPPSRSSGGATNAPTNIPATINRDAANLGIGFPPGLPSMLRRRRLAGTHPTTPPAPSSTSGPFRLRLVSDPEPRRSLQFDAITRDMHVGDPALQIGRFMGDLLNGSGVINNDPRLFKLTFESIVVSRAHAELWVEAGPPSALGAAAPKLFIRDTKSSTGTFLNGIRLESPSHPYQLKDGDLLQLGESYRGESDDIYKCVRIRIELGQEWESAPAIDAEVPVIESLDTTLPPAPGADLTPTSEDEPPQLILPVIPEENLEEELFDEQDTLPLPPVVDLTEAHGSQDEQLQLQDPKAPVIHEKSNTELPFRVDDVADKAALPLPSPVDVDLTLTCVSEDIQSQPQNPPEAPAIRWNLPQTPITAPASATHNPDQANFGAFSFASDFEVHNSQFNSAHIINQTTILNQPLEPGISLCTATPVVNLSSGPRGTSYQHEKHAMQLPESENYGFLQTIAVWPLTQNQFVITSLCILCISILFYYFW